MANRILKDAIYTSDKLAACREPAAFTLPLGDLSRILYAYLVCLTDDWGCYELNPRVIQGICFHDFVQEPGVEQIAAWHQQWNTNGLLFVWEENRKLWCYRTGEESGRLPRLSRRHRRKTPTLGYPERKPCVEWKEVRLYLQRYAELNPAIDGFAAGYKTVRTASASLLPVDAPSASASAAPKSVNQQSLTRQSPSNPPPGLTPIDASMTHIDPGLSRSQIPVPDPVPDPELSASSSPSRCGGSLRGERMGGEQYTEKEILEELRKLQRQTRVRKNGRDAVLIAGINRKRLFADYDDIVLAQRHTTDKSFPALAYVLLERCIGNLLANRGFTHLRGVNEKELVGSVWEKIEGNLPLFEQLQDYESRKRQFGGYLINCVVVGARRLSHGKN